MPLSNAIILAGIVVAFGTFGIVLAWAEYQTRHLARDRSRGADQADKPDDEWKRAA